MSAGEPTKGLIMPRMYCLGCYYDLRGLPENRCPECGRFFSPGNPKSYSVTPRPQTFRKLMKQVEPISLELIELEHAVEVHERDEDRE